MDYIQYISNMKLNKQACPSASNTEISEAETSHKWWVITNRINHNSSEQLCYHMAQNWT